MAGYSYDVKAVDDAQQALLKKKKEKEEAEASPSLFARAKAAMGLGTGWMATEGPPVKSTFTSAVERAKSRK